MTDMTTPQSDRQVTQVRKPFVAPVVESMGHLQSLTLLQGVTLVP
jgi:hypothetical protein